MTEAITQRIINQLRTHLPNLPTYPCPISHERKRREEKRCRRERWKRPEIENRLLLSSIHQSATYLPARTTLHVHNHNAKTMTIDGHHPSIYHPFTYLSLTLPPLLFPLIPNDQKNFRILQSCILHRLHDREETAGKIF